MEELFTSELNWSEQKRSQKRWDSQFISFLRYDGPHQQHFHITISNFQKDKDAEMAFRWFHCALTQQRLQEPIVMCGLGRLYSKQNIIEQLLDRDKPMPDSCRHIKSLRDVRDLHLTPNPTYNKDADKTEGMLDHRSAPYICKLIGLEMSGKLRFIGLWSCGCVFSERALKEIGTRVCSLCQTSFTDDDVVVLNASDEELGSLALKMEHRAARRKADKKSSKSSKKLATTASSDAVVKSEIETADSFEAPKMLPSSVPIVSNKIIKTELIKPEKSQDGAGPSRTAKSKVPKRPTASDALLDPEMKKLKDGKDSVATDPKATDVYKSLFTSHKSAHEQDRAHWVTYNPFYNWTVDKNENPFSSDSIYFWVRWRLWDIE